jgi:hypothetical protein
MIVDKFASQRRSDDDSRWRAIGEDFITASTNIRFHAAVLCELFDVTQQCSGSLPFFGKRVPAAVRAHGASVMIA